MADQSTPTPPKIKPLFLIAPGTMKLRDIKRAEKLCGIVIAECTKSDEARFLEPPVLLADIDTQARAALQMMRYVIRETASTTTSFYGANLIRSFVNMLVEEPRPTSVPRVTAGGSAGKK